MDISPVVSLILGTDKVIGFRRNPIDGYQKPSPEECKEALKGIYLAASSEKQNLTNLKMAFSTLEDGTIRNVPLEIAEEGEIRAIKCGNVTLNEEMTAEAIRVGIIGFFNSSNVIICAAPEYGFVIDSIMSFIKPNITRITTSIGVGTLAFLS